MLKKIAFNDLEIQKLFQNFYVIPPYQREFVWQEKEVVQLLDDIYEAFSNNPESEYFLRSLVVCNITAEAKLEVIDGQQRLITLTLILNNIRRRYKIEGKNSTTIERYLRSAVITDAGETVHSNVIDIRYEGKEVLDDLINSDDDEAINPRMVEGLPGKTIYDAHSNIMIFLDDAFKLKDGFMNLKKFLGYLLNKVKVIQIETPEIGNALKIFETINERGIGLDQVDLLKNVPFHSSRTIAIYKIGKRMGQI